MIENNLSEKLENIEKELLKMLRRIDCERPSDIMELIIPFIRIAKNGCFELSPEGDIYKFQIQAALEEIFGIDTKKVFFVSPKSFPNSGWTPFVNYKNSLMSRLYHPISETTWGEICGESLVGNKKKFIEILRTIFVKGLGDSFQQTFGSMEKNHEYLHAIRINIFVSVLYFVIFSILGEEERANRIKPLLEILPRYPFFTGKKGDQYAQIVLVK